MTRVIAYARVSTDKQDAATKHFTSQAFNEDILDASLGARGTSS